MEGSSLPWRDNKEKLEARLGDLPLQVRGFDLRLKAYMGGGKIVYIEPTRGTVRGVILNGVTIFIRQEDRDLYFSYRRQKFELRYGYAMPPAPVKDKRKSKYTS